MANNFLKHQGIAVGQSLLEEGSEEMIKEIYTLANKTGCEIHLPTDVILNDERSLAIDHLSDQNQFSILDLSNRSIELLEQLVQRSEIVLINNDHI